MTTRDVIPMPSARLAAGNYEVLGTSQACQVMRTPLGWELVVNGSTFAIFPTKRAALQACQGNTAL